MRQATKGHIKKIYYFKDANKELYYNVAEEIYIKKGVEHKRVFLYSATKYIK
jgi:hypothetical protein